MESPNLLLGTVRDRVVLKKLNIETKTPGGLVIAETERTQIVTGEVYAVGRGTITVNGTIVPLELKRGDRVLFHIGSANEILVKSESFFIVKEADILATLREEPPAVEHEKSYNTK